MAFAIYCKVDKEEQYYINQNGEKCKYKSFFKITFIFLEKQFFQCDVFLGFILEPHSNVVEASSSFLQEIVLILQFVVLNFCCSKFAVDFSPEMLAHRTKHTRVIPTMQHCRKLPRLLEIAKPLLELHNWDVAGNPRYWKCKTSVH